MRTLLRSFCPKINTEMCFLRKLFCEGGYLIVSRKEKCHHGELEDA